MNDLEFETIKLHLRELMEERSLSLSKLSYRVEMQRTQLKHYYDGSIQRLDRLSSRAFAMPSNAI